MKIFLLLLVLLILLPSIGCVTGFPVQQTGMISSYPSGADLYLSEELGTKESYIGKTPISVSLVSDRPYDWKIRAAHKGYEPLVCFVHGGKDIDHHFAFSDISKEMLLTLQEKFKPYGFDVIEFVNFAKNNFRAPDIST
jgi:hypothetical protein